MRTSVYLVTPPFTQLNTPYPATAYLKGFLNTKEVPSFQSDLGIEVTLALFSRQGLERVFERASRSETVSENAARMLALTDAYLETVESVIGFLQGKNPTLAHLIAGRGFLPEASRFKELDDLNYSFGTMGIQDKAKHLATMYLEDISDLIKETVDPHFGFSRYAERLGRSANSFDELYEALAMDLSIVDEMMLQILEAQLDKSNPILAAFSVPFPGNLFAAFRCAQWIRKHRPDIRIAMGGGFPNTELRSLNDPRVFEFFHYICLDDGESPLEQLLLHLQGAIGEDELKRSFLLRDGAVVFIDNKSCQDYRLGQVGVPDYTDLRLNDYISAIEITNPMHSLWSDGRWNKLTMAHGCYWGKCTFCDISLDYIRNYEPLTASVLCDRMEEIISKTGNTGFHFVDEAAPPALMRALALEIIRRKMVVSWWTNIRFEKSFTRDLCLLLKASGCIAVSGGLEVASDRLLQLIQKGITVSQVARVNKYFAEAGIMVHAYLMYGFPTQTAQETIDSLEMVRQMFQAGVLQSAYWHQFAMTAHSPVGLEPERFQVARKNEDEGSFANNDLEHLDPTGAEHESFSYGLRKSLHNFMHGACLDLPLHKWFDFKVPKTTVAPGFIQKALAEADLNSSSGTRVVFIGQLPEPNWFTKSKKGNTWEMISLTFQSRTASITVSLNKAEGDWLYKTLPTLRPDKLKLRTRQELRDDFERSGLENFELFWDNKPVTQLHKFGLLQF